MGPRVVIVRAADPVRLRRCLRLFHEHLNHRFNFPVWIVPVRSFHPEQMVLVKQEAPWAQFPTLGLEPPYDRAFEQWFACRLPLEYPDLAFALRLDDRAEIHSWVPYNPFDRLGQGVFGYRATVTPPFARSHGLLSYLSARTGAKAARAWRRRVSYESGFQVHRLDFWRTGTPGALVRGLLSDRVFYNHTWTAATVQTILLRAYASPGQLVHLRDFSFAAGPRSWMIGT